MKETKEETKSGFLIKNLLNGLLWLGIILVIFLVAEEYIQDNFRREIDNIKDQPLIVFGSFFISEVVFGIIPPVIYMTMWKLLMNVSLTEYVINNLILTVISIVCGFIGYELGNRFSKTRIYQKIEERYLKQYNVYLRKYGVFLVVVGALTPVPFSGTCMLAGSVQTNYRAFFWACMSRVFYFLVYGWITWTFPELFS